MVITSVFHVCKIMQLHRHPPQRPEAVISIRISAVIPSPRPISSAGPGETDLLHHCIRVPLTDHTTGTLEGKTKWPIFLVKAS